MRMMFAMLALVAAPAPLAAQSAPTPASAVSAKPDPMQKRVCRSDTATGSHFSKRTCHTKAEWAEIDGVNRRSAPSAGVGGMQSEPFTPR